jgi:hypothetical protein
MSEPVHEVLETVQERLGKRSENLLQAMNGESQSTEEKSSIARVAPAKMARKLAEQLEARASRGRKFPRMLWSWLSGTSKSDQKMAEVARQIEKATRVTQKEQADLLKDHQTLLAKVAALESRLEQNERAYASQVIALSRELESLRKHG